MSLAGTEDDTDVTFGTNDTATNLPRHKHWTLRGFRVNLQSVPHEEDDHKYFELPVREMPGERIRSAEPPTAWRLSQGINESTDLPGHIETPPPQGIEWFAMNFPFL